MSQKLWLLPEGVEDLFSNQATLIERIRKKLTKQLHTWGYEQVIPAMFESLDSLAVSGNSELIDHSFKLTDPISGKIIALRVDMTTQVARMDACSNNQNIARFYYVGHIFRGKKKHYKNSRTPIQLGAEIYGHRGIESDIEIIEMALRLLFQCGYQNLLIDIGHTKIFNTLIEPILLHSNIDKKKLFQIIKQKSIADLKQILGSQSQSYQDIKDLMTLIGGTNVIDELKKRFNFIEREFLEIEQLIKTLSQRFEKEIHLNWHIDLSNRQNYLYHNGLVFNVIDCDNNTTLAKGGRYDNIGAPFGISRPATGFSMFIDQLKDLKLKPNEKIYITFKALNHSDLSDKLTEIKNQFDENDKEIQFIRALGEEKNTYEQKRYSLVLEVMNGKLELIKK